MNVFADQMRTTLAKRETLRRLWNERREQYIAEKRLTLANMYFGYGIRLDKGRYDDQLDTLIAEARAELATPSPLKREE